MERSGELRGVSPATAAAAVVLQEEKSTSTFFKPLDSEESLQFNFYPN